MTCAQCVGVDSISDPTPPAGTGSATIASLSLSLSLSLSPLQAQLQVIIQCMYGAPLYKYPGKLQPLGYMEVPFQKRSSACYTHIALFSRASW